MTEEIFDHDVVSRYILEPIDFNNGVLDLRMGFQFSSKNNRCQSVNCHRLLNNDTEAIHKLGIEKQNLDHSMGKFERKYKGYCESIVELIRSIDINSLANFKVYHCPENNNNAHCHIELYIKEKKDNVRAVAINKLIDCFSKPFVKYQP